MKKLIKRVSELLGGYLLWLERFYYYNKGGVLVKFKPTSVNNYKIYMAMALSDLGMQVWDFAFRQPTFSLELLLDRLKMSAQFKNRDLKIQSDIVSAFHAYIKFKTQS